MLPTLVLTAGIGSRLDPITRLVAKPAVPLAGSPLIERLLDRLRRQGVTDVVLNLHHRPETITALVGDGRHLGMRVRYSWEPRLLGSAGGPRHALSLLGTGDLLLVNGDTLSDVPLAPLLDAHRRSGAAATLAVVPNPAPDQYNGVRLDESGVITGFVPRGQATGTWHFVGVQVVSAALLAPLADGEAADTVAGFYRVLAATEPGRVRAWPLHTPFLDVGTPRDYLETALGLSPGTSSVIEAGARVHPSARLVRTVVWPEAQVGANAVLDRCVVAGPVALPAGLCATRATIVPATLVRPPDRVTVEGGAAVFPWT